MAVISLEGMTFIAHHGLHNEEREKGNNFIVDLHVTTDAQKAIETDDLEKGLNYETLYLLVEEEMKTSSKLLEHVAGRILNSIKAVFPQVTEVEVKVSKLNPPFQGKIQKASVIIRG